MVRFSIFSALLIAVAMAGCDEQQASASRQANMKTVAAPVVSLPEHPRVKCPTSRARLYGECLNQSKVFKSALVRSRKENKTLLVSYGAEWCVWCHVLDRHLKGETFVEFDYTFHDGTTYEQVEPSAAADAIAAKELGEYVADNFVLVHIDSDDAFGKQPKGGGGWDVIRRARAQRGYEDSIPYVFAVNADGTLSSDFDTSNIEKRNNDGYRGYDRRGLLALAKQVRRTALQ